MKKSWKSMVAVLLVLCMVFQAGMVTSFAEGGPSTASIQKLQVEYMTNPIGLDNTAPRFSWTMADSVRGQKQTAYEIMVATTAQKLAAGEYDVWDSGKVVSDESVAIAYAGTAALQPSTRYYWQVRVWDKDGAAALSSETAYFETGLMDEGFTGAQWIQGISGMTLHNASWIWMNDGSGFNARPQETMYFRNKFAVDPEKSVTSATLSFSADDYGDVFLNGNKIISIANVTDAWKTGNIVDITSKLTSGDNVIAAAISNASSGYAGFISKTVINYTDGTNDIIVTDGKKWKLSKSPASGWEQVQFDDSSWVLPEQAVLYGGSPWNAQVNLPSLAKSAPMLRKEFAAKASEDASGDPVYSASKPVLSGTALKEGLATNFTGYRGDIPINYTPGGPGYCLKTSETYYDFTLPEDAKVTVAISYQARPGTSRGLDYAFDDNSRTFCALDQSYDTRYMTFSSNLSAGKHTLNLFPPTGFDDTTLKSCDIFTVDIFYEKSSAPAIASARLYATAAGVYQMNLNGQVIGEDFLDPGRTEYDEHIMYQTFDVTELVQAGGNALSATLGRGWYLGAQGGYGGTEPALLAKLIITYSDGSVQEIVTDSSWNYSGQGPILYNDIFHGETYDATREINGWDEAGFDDSSWTPATEVTQASLNIGEIVAQIGGAVKCMDVVTAKSMTQPQPGVYIYDLGQNLTGVAQITVTGEAGQTVKLRHGEMLNDADGPARGCDGPKGTLYTANLRSAKATDYYTLKGDPNGETYSPIFTYHGFRYVEITGIDEPLPLDAVKGLVWYSEMEDTNTFESSNELVNKLYSNTYWGQRGNFLSVPTDCPQRDERCGWTGDAQVFARTASLNMNVNQFMYKYMMDLNDCQREDGAYPDVAPAAHCYPNWGTGGWAEVGIIVPWQMYQQYGDTQIITNNYSEMCAFIEYLVKDAGADWIKDHGWTGDWLSIGESTPFGVTDTGYCVYACDLMSKMSAAIGKDEDAAKFAGYAENFRNAWNNAYLKEDGSTTCNTQTSYVLGLYFNIIPENMRDASAKWLVANIEANGWRLKTGFLGVSYLNPALTDTGHNDVAYRLLEQEEYPSWLYPVLQGATTIWERWNSYTLESGFGPVGMNSFNHYSYGSIIEWVYKDLLGIERDEANPGYKHIILQPTFGGTLTYAKGSYDSVYGTIVSDWALENDSVFVYNATVPANTTATLYLPAAEGTSITEGGVNAADAEGVTFVKMENGTAVYELESGSYCFRSPVSVSRTTTVSLSAEDSGVPVKVSVNGEEYTLPTTLFVQAGAELAIQAAPLNDVDYAVTSWKDAEGGVIADGSSITITPTEKTSLTVGTEWIGYDNLAIGAKVTAGQVNADWAASNLTDGILSYHGGTNGWSSPSQGKNVTTFNEVTAVIDLGEVKELNRFHIYPRNLPTEAEDVGVMNCPTAYTFYISNDNQNWTPVYSTDNGPVTNSFAPIVVELSEAVSARYVKFGCTGINHPDEHETAYVQLSELGVYNVRETPPIEEPVTAPESVTVDTEFSMTVVTPATVDSFAIFGERDLSVHYDVDSMTADANGNKVWNIRLRLGTIGLNRILRIYTRTASDQPYEYYTAFHIRVNPFAPESVTAGEWFDITFEVVPGAKVTIVNEYGLRMGIRLKESKTATDGNPMNTYSMNISTVGENRKFDVYTQLPGEEAVWLGDFEIDVTPQTPQMINASIEETAVVGKTVKLTAVTDKNVAKLMVYNEFGAKMGTLSQSYEEVDGQRVWTVEMKIGTAGTRCFTVQGKSVHGLLTESVTTNAVIVKWF